MSLKLAVVAASILAVALLAAPSGLASAQPALTRGSAPSLGAATHPAGIARSAGARASSQNDGPRLSPGPVIGLLCAIVASALALGVAFGLRRRIDRIGGPNPDNEDD